MQLNGTVDKVELMSLTSICATKEPLSQAFEVYIRFVTACVTVISKPTHFTLGLVTVTLVAFGAFNPPVF